MNNNYCKLYWLVWASLVAQRVKNPPAMQDTWVRSLGWEDHLDKGTAAHSSILPGEFLGLWRHRLSTSVFMDFPGGSDGKESAYHTGDLGLSPGSGRSPGGGYGNPLQYSCLENSPMDRGSWWAAVRRVAKSWTGLKWLSVHTRCKTAVYSDSKLRTNTASLRS